MSDAHEAYEAGIAIVGEHEMGYLDLGMKTADHSGFSHTPDTGLLDQVKECIAFETSNRQDPELAKNDAFVLGVVIGSVRRRAAERGEM